MIKIVFWHGVGTVSLVKARLFLEEYSIQYNLYNSIGTAVSNVRVLRFVIKHLFRISDCFVLTCLWQMGKLQALSSLDVSGLGPFLCNGRAIIHIFTGFSWRILIIAYLFINLVNFMNIYTLILVIYINNAYICNQMAEINYGQ